MAPAEELYDDLQAIGRAAVVAERSPGIVLTAAAMQLPNGATLMYPNGGTTTADGSAFEGTLDRSLLLQSIDSQLEAAK